MSRVIEGPLRRVELSHEVWPIDGVFRLSRGAKTEAHVLIAVIEQGSARGRGEAVPYLRYGETVGSALEAAAEAARPLSEGANREELQRLAPPGAARNALDCALWDLEARLSGVPVWRAIGLEVPPGPVITAATISLDEPEVMEEKARRYSRRPLLKLKLGLGPERDLERVAAVRRGAPSSRLIVDVNEGWSVGDYRRLAPALADLGVELIEQPLPASEDKALAAALPRPVPVCADESCHSSLDLEGLVEGYDAVNLKLDKAGGLTEALKMKARARQLGLEVMVGSMVSTSLALAPAVLLAQGVGLVDLDGALLLARDRPEGLRYGDDGSLSPPEGRLWGGRG